MKLMIDNSGAVDIANNWSVGGYTRHMDVRKNFLREAKEDGTIHVIWTPSAEMSSDLFTKNLPGPLFDNHHWCWPCSI